MAAVVALAGCSTAVRGKGQAAGNQPAPPTSSSSSDAPSSPDAPSSSGGSSTPRVPLSGAIIESHRLGPYQVSPDDIFHVKQDTCQIPKGPFPSVSQAESLVFGDNSGTLLKIGGYVTGWFNCFNIKGAKNSIGGVLGVMEAYDESHAKLMAQALAISTSGGKAKSSTLPGLPQAYVGVYPTSDASNSAINGLVVEGRMVVYVDIDTGTTPGGQGRLDTVRGMASNLIRKELAKIKSFTPTPADKIGKLDDDPQQLDAKTLQPAGDPDWSAGGYSVQTYSDVATDAAKEVPVLKENGMTEAYYRTGVPSGETNTQLGAVSLYELKDKAAAKRVQSFELKLAKETDKTTTGLPLPKGKTRKGAPVVPKDITCLLSYPNGTSDFHEFRHDCWVVAGRYVAQVDLYWSAEDSKVAHTRSKDSSRVLKMVDDQLKLTPQ